MHKTYLVAMREFMENLRTKTFWIGVLAFPLVVIESISPPGPWGSARLPGLFSWLVAGRLDDLPPVTPATPAPPVAPATAVAPGPTPTAPASAAR